jgi:DnaJ-class molecular chaperone
MDNQGRYMRFKPMTQQRCNYCYGTGKESDGYKCRTCGGRGWV